MDSAFFVIAKLGWLIVQPISLIFFLIVLALAAAGLRRWRLAVAGAGLAAIALYVSAFTTTGSLLLATLEDHYPAQPPLDAPVVAIIVLGGGFEGHVTHTRGGYALGQSGDRFAEAAMLARAHPDATIVVSGGAASLTGTNESDATIAPRFFSRLGIGPQRLVLEGQSDDTFENARRTVPLLEPLSGRDSGVVLLVTSAFHMKRAMAVFEAQGVHQAQGLEVVAWPVDFRTDGQGRWRLFDIHATRNLHLTTTALREMLGHFVYAWVGRL